MADKQDRLQVWNQKLVITYTSMKLEASLKSTQSFTRRIIKVAYYGNDWDRIRHIFSLISYPKEMLYNYS